MSGFVRRVGGGVRRFAGRPVGLIVSAAAIAAVITGLALADAGAPPSGGYVALSPAHKILSAASIGANATSSPVAIGGATTVPSNASAVQMTVTVKGAQSGTLKIFPAGDPTARGATVVPFTGGTTLTTTVQETVGMSSKISFQNVSAGAATVTATITGYSPALTAGIIGAHEQIFGGLPGSFSFTKKEDASDLLITFSGSAFSTTANTKHSLQAQVDAGTPQVHLVGTSNLFFNNTFEHLTFPTVQTDVGGTFIPIAAGTHTLSLTTDGATDSNDYTSVTIVEVMREGG